MIVRQRIFQGLQTFHRLAESSRFLLPGGQETESEEGLNAEEFVVIVFV